MSLQGSSRTHRYRCTPDLLQSDDIMLRSGPREASVLQLVLVQVVDVQLLASGGQDLLLLLSLSLFLASSLLVGLDSKGKHLLRDGRRLTHVGISPLNVFLEITRGQILILGLIFSGKYMNFFPKIEIINHLLPLQAYRGFS